MVSAHCACKAGHQAGWVSGIAQSQCHPDWVSENAGYTNCSSNGLNKTERRNPPLVVFFLNDQGGQGGQGCVLNLGYIFSPPRVEWVGGASGTWLSTYGIVYLYPHPPTTLTPLVCFL